MRHDLFLLRELVKRDFQGRYAGSLLGFLWSFVNPLWRLLLFTFVFSTVMAIRISARAEGTDNFAIFLFCGLLPWMAIQEGVLRGTTAITDNSALVKKLRFPSEILVLTVAIAALLHEAIAAVIFCVVVTVIGDIAWASLPWLLLAVVLQTMLVVGLGLTLSAVNVFFRDTSQLLPMLLEGWFYFTPIVYPLSMVPERFARWIELNPLTALVDLYRTAFLGGELAGWWQVARLAIVATLVLLFGLWFFRRARPAFVDEI